jgi:hypothetical protein
MTVARAKIIKSLSILILYLTSTAATAINKMTDNDLSKTGHLLSKPMAAP